MKKLLIGATIIGLIPTLSFAEDKPGFHFIESWDLNDNGSVSLEEITERRGDVFFMFDQDENGILNAEEYVLFDETRAADMENNAGSHGKRAGRIQEGLTLAFNDSDADGEVSKAEFLANSTSWVTQIDRDSDGMITAADFGPKR
ncbi:MAG: hypothetical protein ACI9KK_001481 [Ascidiaceihabitans sp.]|jgi:hypothetical protein